MKKLLFVGVLAFAAYPALACDFNREASAQDQVVATTAATTDQTPQAAPTAPASPSATSEQSARKPVDATTGIVLITNRQ
jgi:Tfp pilus assembly protein PilV